MGMGAGEPHGGRHPARGSYSPFLSNVVLEDLDQELEQRGHRFARYADAANIYVKSKRAGQRAMKSLAIFIAQTLTLTVNRAKSTVAQLKERQFLEVQLHRRERGEAEDRFSRAGCVK